MHFIVIGTILDSDHFYIKYLELSNIFRRDVQVNRTVIFRTDKNIKFQKRDFKSV